jgi:hypothetical protein
MPVAQKIKGWKRLAEDLTKQLEDLDIDLEDLAKTVVARAEALLQSEGGAIARIREQLSLDQPDLSPNMLQTLASRQRFGQLGEPFMAILEQEPQLETISQRPRCLARYLASEEVPQHRRLELYLGLLPFLALDAATEAFGAPGPLNLDSTLQALVQLERTPAREVVGGLRKIRTLLDSGRGRHLFHQGSVQEQIMIIDDAQQGFFDGLGTAIAREVADDFYDIDLEKAPKQRQTLLDLPEATRGKPLQLHLRGFNIQEWILVEVRFFPVQGGLPFRVILRNLPSTFEGLVANAKKEVAYDQILTSSFPSWCLPPGSYRVEIQGERLPATYRVLTWCLEDLYLTW